MIKKTFTMAPIGTNLSPHLERNDRGRDFVVGDVHGHFATLRRVLAELEVSEHDRVISLGDLVDRGPDSWAAKDWIAGADPSQRFHLVIRGNHEQMMLAALVESPRRRLERWDNDAWSLWMMNGGDWWRATSRDQSATVWIDALSAPPLCARVETGAVPVGLVHASPVGVRKRDLHPPPRTPEISSGPPGTEDGVPA